MHDTTLQALERRIADLEERLREKPRRATAPILHIRTGDGHIVEAGLDHFVAGILHALTRDQLVAVLRKVAQLKAGVGVTHFREVSMQVQPPTQEIKVPSVVAPLGIGRLGQGG